ncbi:MAG: sigma-54 dependent transcriptional regulator [Candidatus Thiodiazotropha lotti]|nr:sigma-54 dependent transcriptional regulator [Candidatus Thiodiazotropha weberae]MCG7931525.1 sigma-54 dependent transcriptional regulator [Candidatus Thiodiazotropha lotti]MCG7982942.1 sigma-54 dependent transcriptional regulator [Candidatus Thiodiazotropha lotti]MCW4221372.1 sigma-54 dependent transcriptional regulator [Candidatus Thiodiazotropha lotti]
MKQMHVLVVDDEAAIRQVLAAQLTRAGHTVEQADCGEMALKALQTSDLDVCICDLRLPDLDGIEVIRRCRAKEMDIAFLMITAFASVDTAIEAMKLGAYDYLMKPVQLDDVLIRLEHIADVARLRDENRYLRKIVETDTSSDALGLSAPMREIQTLIKKVSRTDGTVFITGESGTGKSHIARTIHNESNRRDRTMVTVNCGAIPKELLESELFGHIKGAFTGADRNKKGLFREADGGTLFLDEIGELPLALQVKLLHVIEEKVVRPLGAEQSRRVDVRIIAATNRNIAEMMQGGEFREDLYYRLNVLHITLPPLRSRQEDISLYIEYFLNSEIARLGLEGRYSIDPEVEEQLLNYEWPGNLRELQNVIARMLVLADEYTINMGDLPSHVTRYEHNGGKYELSKTFGSLRDQVRQFEIGVIKKAIDAAENDRALAARSLDIGLSTLYRKLEER